MAEFSDHDGVCRTATDHHALAVFQPHRLTMRRRRQLESVVRDDVCPVTIGAPVHRPSEAMHPTQAWLQHLALILAKVASQCHASHLTELFWTNQAELAVVKGHTLHIFIMLPRWVAKEAYPVCQLRHACVTMLSLHVYLKTGLPCPGPSVFPSPATSVLRSRQPAL